MDKLLARLFKENIQMIQIRNNGETELQIQQSFHTPFDKVVLKFLEGNGYE